MSYTGPFNEGVARHMFRQMLLGLEACHKNGVAHRDLKPENILLDEEYNVRIADFGAAATFNTHAIRTTVRYLEKTQ